MEAEEQEDDDQSWFDINNPVHESQPVTVHTVVKSEESEIVQHSSDQSRRKEHYQQMLSQQNISRAASIPTPLDGMLLNNQEHSNVTPFEETPYMEADTVSGQVSIK